jgi:hypothetical protein
MTYELTVPNNRRNRQIMLAILRNFSGIEAEFTNEHAAEGIRLATDSQATWTSAVAAFEEGPQP